MGRKSPDTRPAAQRPELSVVTSGAKAAE